MTAQESADFESIGRRMRPRLIRLNRLRRVAGCLTVVVYSAVLCWMAGCLLVAFFGWQQLLPEQTPGTWKYVMAGFAVFCMLHFALMYSLTRLREREQGIMREAVGQMFPGAVYHAGRSVSRRVLSDSSLFEVFGGDGNPAWTTGYGCIDFRGDGRNTSVYDIGVTSDRQAGIMEHVPVLGALLMLYRSLIRPIFGTPVENSLHGFRGLFGVCAGRQSCRGRVILLPDRLEGRLGYLAHSIQAFRKKNGASHVVLEDPEFENLFAVYADDEVEARKILTPAVMRRITRLRQDFGRDLMMSFSGDMIYYAAPFYEGFLRPSRDSLNDKELFGQKFRQSAYLFRFFLYF